MALYTVETVKYRAPTANRDAETWRNVFHVVASDIATAQGYASDISDVEKQIYWDDVSIIEEVVYPTTGGGRLVSAVAVAGTRADANEDTLLPLFVTVYVRFYASGGRGWGLHFRPPVDETDIDGGRLNNDVHDLFQSGLISDLFALGFVSNKTGSVMTGGVADRRVHDRQTSWSRRSRPGFHRGYVPD